MSLKANYVGRAKMDIILFFIYTAAGIWAANRTIYANKILFGPILAIYMRKAMVGIMLGWILIPVAIIKGVLSR